MIWKYFPVNKLMSNDASFRELLADSALNDHFEVCLNMAVFDFMGSLVLI